MFQAIKATSPSRALVQKGTAPPPMAANRLAARHRRYGTGCIQPEFVSLAASRSATRASVPGDEQAGQCARAVVTRFSSTVAAIWTRTNANAFRRRHTLATVQARLLAMLFLSRGSRRAGQFAFDHEGKIAVFTDAGCPSSTLPQRGGEAYLREQFLL